MVKSVLVYALFAPTLVGDTAFFLADATYDIKTEGWSMRYLAKPVLAYLYEYRYAKLAGLALTSQWRR